jgi:plastocyanin
MAVYGPLKMVRYNSPAKKASAATAGNSGEARVNMAGLTFTPGVLAVRKGTEVLFDNDDLAPHTVTSEDRSIDSGLLNPGKAFKLVINAPLSYICTIHPQMKARVDISG